MNLIAWVVFIFAALLEVSGDAVIRSGLRGHKPALLFAGCATLAGYGLLVNSQKWDFSKLLGVYIGFFAVAAVLIGAFVFHEKISLSTWLGLILIIVGSIFIQSGR